jgi:predicted nucleic acid-binding protein
LALCKKLIETTILVDYFRKKQNAIDYLESIEKRGYMLLVPQIVAAELFYGCRNITEEIELEQFLSTRITVVKLADDIMKMAGALKRQYGKAYECGLIDMLIAATALIENVPLVTLNRKHFQMIAGLSIEKPY